VDVSSVHFRELFKPLNHLVTDLMDLIERHVSVYIDMHINHKPRSAVLGDGMVHMHHTGHRFGSGNKILP
jgi:hypothetical protein